MQKIKKIVIIGGCGHVGLPLGIVFANCGLDVVLLDRDQSKIDAVNAGQMPFMETNALEVLGRVVGKKLFATSDASCLRDADAAIAVLGTPVDEHLNPTVTDLYHSIDEVIARMPENALLVLRSTVYPGVTKLVYRTPAGIRAQDSVVLLPGENCRGQGHGRDPDSAADHLRVRP